MIPNQNPTPTSLIARALARHPDRIAFRSNSGDLSYRGTRDLVARYQAVLTQAGVRRGDRVALLSANRSDSWCAGAAASALGAVTTWMHPLGSLESHLDQWATAEPSILVVDARAFATRGGELAAALPGVPVFTLGPADYGVDLAAAADAAGSHSLVDLSRSQDMGSMGFTGGTTGKSKGVVRTVGGVGHMILTVLAEFELPQRPNYLAVGPISHVTGTKVVPTLIRGGTINLVSKFDPDEVLRTIERERINFMLAVPTMIYSLLDCPAMSTCDLSSLELLLYGASAMSPTRLAEGLERIGPVFSQLYGQSECYPIAVLGKEDHDAARPELLAACGFPVSDCEVALLDEAGEPVAPGEAGEICVRGANVMTEYWCNPALTAETFAGGWLHTGDIAHADEAGRLYIVDRKKDMIVTGGFNVFPREVEDVLSGHPDVAMVAVIGTPDEKWGEAVRAIVVMKAGTAIDPQALIEMVKAAKGGLHAPKHIDFAETLPLTGAGKVDKKVLREPYWRDQGRRVS